MSRNRQPVKAIQKLFKKVSKQFFSAIKKQIIWLLRTFIATIKRRGAMNAGFVLPTVVMVSLVVVLLTTAILFRSFERAKNASNVRVNEVVLNAAAPAIDRARAKLDALFEDPTLPRGTPTDNSLYDALKKDKYRLGDETRLKLGFELPTNPDGTANTAGVQNPSSSTQIEYDETLKSAWKFAVDTDNNGKKDTFTLYGIYFRSPSKNTTTGLFNRKRNALEARTPPMDDSSSSSSCSNAAGFSTLVGNSSWYKLNSGNLGKSFFVYTVNIPITKALFNSWTSSQQSGYEPYNGNQGVVALEFQQDRTRVPLPNNAVWFENDLEVIVGSTTLLLNGRVHTNGNFLVGVQNNDGNITFRQVSSKTSCFYNQENGQIIVGGNVGNGSLSQVNTGTNVNIDLYQGFGKSISTAYINNTNKSTNQSGGSQIGFNDAAYNQRINQMKTDGFNLCTACKTATTGSDLKTAVQASGYPNDVKNNVTAKVNDTDDGTTAQNVLLDQIEIYLRNRTRRVPFAEISDPTGSGATSGYTTITASLDPPQAWREPINSSNQFTSATSVTLTTSQLRATYPVLQKQEGVQTELGDRIFVGNNLPAKWLQSGQYVDSNANQLITSSGSAVNWTRPTSSPPQRWRNTRIQAVTDLGIADRNGFWETAAAQNPANDLDSVGGVRIVTGAGIYVDGSGNTVNTTTGPFYPRGLNSFLTAPNATDSTVVWPDTMPMSSPDTSETRIKGDLLMRATAVYHYKVDYGTTQAPIACVSSYYDPSTSTTARNSVNVNGGYGIDTTNGRSNNGVVYNFPGRSTFGTNKTRLQLQANLRFPNGRLVNQPLSDALAKIGSGTTVPSTGLQLADYSAIDTALCAISILSNPTGFVATPTNLPAHGAIKEASFLDAREARQFSAASTSTNNDLDLEQRQPSEIRVTEINIGSLATTALTSGSGASATTNEYLLPYSGIIYATREDALRDASEPYTIGDVSSTAKSELLSPTDFKLDPTRRPNGIRLINGATLARTSSNTYNAKEKGLILVTNLPAYIEDNFNLHRTDTSSTTQIEEFTETEPTTNFYDRSTPNTNFACRAGRTGCPTTGGDFWRPATLIADSMTLLSGSFQDGFRNEGDYDLNNNTALPLTSNFNPASLTSSVLSALDTTRLNRLKQGFWENNYVTSANWWQSTSGNNPIYPRSSSSSYTSGSYIRNGVTPIQRRVNSHPMYVMEICRKPRVSECVASDWVVGFDINGDGVLSTTASSYTVNGSNVSLVERDIKGYQLGQAIIAAGGSASTVTSSWDTSFGTGSKSIRQRLGAGDTGGIALQSADQRYPRRVAFARDNSNNLVSTASGIYKPMGIGCTLDTTGNTYTGNGCTYASSPAAGTNFGQTGSSALWFRTTSFASSNPSADATYANNNSLFYYPPIDANGDGSADLDGQPLLVPVLQIHDAKNLPTSLRTDTQTQSEFTGQWIQQANSATTFNATYVLGNNPSRATEISAGLQNFVRFLENWNNTAKINGSLIQIKRSSYATGTLAPILTANTSATNVVSNINNLSLFDYLFDTYPSDNVSGILPYYSPPTRSWGFDVALLSEQPDLFAQRFTAPPTGRPNEFFREVGRDDTWITTLLCAGEASNRTGISATGTTITYANAVPSEFRPSSCPTIPND